MSECILSSAYLAPISYYSRLAHTDRTWIETCDSYQKQSYRNRCTIASTDGPLSLTIPVEKPQPGHRQMRDIRISDHGRWRHLHWTALKSAYQSSPFFDYYADELAPFYERKWDFLLDFNADLQRLVCQWIDLDAHPSPTLTYQTDLSPEVEDLRERIHPRLEPLVQVRPYYQVFMQKLGFLNDLSIVDLVFNMGPESILYL